MVRAAVLGSPIAHSLSPALHRAAYAALGLDWQYDAVEVASGGLAGFLAGLDPEWRGLSLTMPLKQEVLPLLSERTRLVEITGAANTVVIEDGAFIGSRAIVVEGVRVGAGAVLAPNVVLSATVPVIDVTGSKSVEYRGEVPPRAVVLPGVRQKTYPAGEYGLPCALIVGERSASTDLKTSLNDVLREFEIAV